MRITVDEQPRQVECGCTLWQLRRQCCPDADVVVHNGIPTASDATLSAGDRVVFVRRHSTDAAAIEQMLRARHGDKVYQRLARASVGIAGVGGLGSAIATALVRAGIGRLIIADCDVVELSNLHRQHYFIDQIGLPKVTALRQTLCRINPHITIEAVNTRLDADNIAAVFAGVDVMIEALDSAEGKAQLTTVWRQQQPDTPLVAASGMAGYASSNTIRTRRVMHGLYLCGDGTSGVDGGTSLMAPRVAIAAGHQANCAIRLLLGLINPDEE